MPNTNGTLPCVIAIFLCPNPLRPPRFAGLERQGDQFLIACGGSKTVSVTVQTPSADCPCGDAGTVGVEIYSISADDTRGIAVAIFVRSEEHTSELQSLRHLVCRLLLEKKKKKNN